MTATHHSGRHTASTQPQHTARTHSQNTARTHTLVSDRFQQTTAVVIPSAHSQNTARTHTGVRQVPAHHSHRHTVCPLPEHSQNTHWCQIGQSWPQHSTTSIIPTTQARRPSHRLLWAEAVSAQCEASVDSLSVVYLTSLQQTCAS